MPALRPLCRPSLRFATALVIAAGLVIVAGLCGAATPRPADPGELAGQLLIAAPTIGDPRFYHAVILLVRQDKTGAFGIILNRPLEKQSIKSLLEAAGDRAAGVEGSIVVFAGGPVEPELGFVVHSTDYHDPHTIAVDRDVAVTADKEILRDIGHHHGPKQSLFAFGYAGWGPGQLQTEIARHDWFTTTGDPKLIFDDGRGELWDDAMARRTREL
ncbi:MAG TPA: YqgE/AlgH family protein [Stellaceae bacterium]|nr:YqgE/AlgH family protein [Stellaceae bacterium]